MIDNTKANSASNDRDQENPIRKAQASRNAALFENNYLKLKQNLKKKKSFDSFPKLDSLQLAEQSPDRYSYHLRNQDLSLPSIDFPRPDDIYALPQINIEDKSKIHRSQSTPPRYGKSNDRTNDHSVGEFIGGLSGASATFVGGSWVTALTFLSCLKNESGPLSLTATMVGGPVLTLGGTLLVGVASGYAGSRAGRTIENSIRDTCRRNGILSASGNSQIVRNKVLEGGDAAKSMDAGRECEEGNPRKVAFFDRYLNRADEIIKTVEKKGIRPMVSAASGAAQFLEDARLAALRRLNLLPAAPTHDPAMARNTEEKMALLSWEDHADEKSEERLMLPAS